MDQEPGWFPGLLPRNLRQRSAWGRARILLLEEGEEPGGIGPCGELGMP